jgi:hypothetical protein
MRLRDRIIRQKFFDRWLPKREINEAATKLPMQSAKESSNKLRYMF